MKEQAASIKRIVKYSEFKGSTWSTLMSKLAHSPTTPAKAAHLRKLVKGYNEASERIVSDFDETMLTKYARKNEDGTVFREGGNQAAYEIPEENQEAFQKALQEDFGKREITIEMNGRPLTADVLSDIKMTAQEVDTLGDFYVEEAGPGLPHLSMQR